VNRLRLALEIVAAYAAARRHQRGRPLPETLSALRRARPQPAAGDPVQTGRNLANPIVRTLTVLPADSRCLIRSLVMTRLLARRGVASTLVLGVSRDRGFEAHAWVEVNGQPVLPTLRFERLTEL
jgi:hypothetical protein